MAALGLWKWVFKMVAPSLFRAGQVIERVLGYFAAQGIEIEQSYAARVLRDTEGKQYAERLAEELDWNEPVSRAAMMESDWEADRRYLVHYQVQYIDHATGELIDTHYNVYFQDLMSPNNYEALFTEDMGAAMDEYGKELVSARFDFIEHHRGWTY